MERVMRILVPFSGLLEFAIFREKIRKNPFWSFSPVTCSYEPGPRSLSPDRVWVETFSKKCDFMRIDDLLATLQLPKDACHDAQGDQGDRFLGLFILSKIF